MLLVESCAHSVPSSVTAPEVQLVLEVQILELQIVELHFELLAAVCIPLSRQLL